MNQKQNFQSKLYFCCFALSESEQKILKIHQWSNLKIRFCSVGFVCHLFDKLAFSCSHLALNFLLSIKTTFVALLRVAPTILKFCRCPNVIYRFVKKSREAPANDI